jgi:hypothetical protein
MRKAAAFTSPFRAQSRNPEGDDAERNATARSRLRESFRRRQADARSSAGGEPGDHLPVLVGGIVLADDVDELAGRHLCLEGIASRCFLSRPIDEL